MAAPLSPTPSAALNFSTPSTSVRHETYETRTCTASPASQPPAGDNTENSNDGDGDSSPFLSHIKDDASPTPRGPSPPKARPGSRIISGSELSPLKILQQQQQMQIQAQAQTQQSPASTDEAPSPAKSMPPPLPQSPRKMSAPIKRFPVKVSQPGSAASESSRRSSSERRHSAERPASLQDAVRENEGLKHAIDIFEDDDNGVGGGADYDADHALPTARNEKAQSAEDEHSAADDSVMSTFSTFSAVPNLTMLAEMRSGSPTKFSATGDATPRATSRTPRASGPLPDRSGTAQLYDSGGAHTTNLMDFTEQMRYGSYMHPTPSRRGAMPSSNMTTAAVAAAAAAAAATPQRPAGGNLVNIMDFDLPPLPTPRSVPSITPRELESLKSSFLSEISSLKASLSGKEAEVLSLKTAVGDAEKRVGECMEQLREAQSMLEPLQAEKDSWERRGREMESVLRKVREEMVHSQREREELEFKLDEAEKRREAAEMMAQEAESKMAGMRAGKASAEAAAASAGSGGPVVGTNKEVEMAVERVARELHGLYKIKHQDKVAALKKSYEQRWEKKVLELQAQVDELTREREEYLRAGREMALHRIDPAVEEERRAERARDVAHIRELEAEVEKVEAVLKTVQADNAELRVLLERERVEKGELVMLAEEMMNMQSFVAAPEEPSEPALAPAPAAPAHAPAPAAVNGAKTPSRRQSSTVPARTPMTAVRQLSAENATANNFRMSVSGANGFRASGLKAPGVGLKGPSAAGESRIGRMTHHERTKSAAMMGNGFGGGLPRPGSGQGTRSVGIMSSIEKMGGYGRRGE
ncbi:Kinetoplast-associated protein KAP [Madurella fahalii]|uniref:Kinetoplast-associated protein KAP n=1 Tax=Madurella fahalii TaxID=1157608 RepID=A0ABQ0G813_9PEZI